MKAEYRWTAPCVAMCPVCRCIGTMSCAIGGWIVCGMHGDAYLTSSKYDGRCVACRGRIAKGTPVMLIKDPGGWVALHPPFACGWSQSWTEVPDDPTPIRSPYACLHLTPDAPMPLVHAAHRALAAIHHPDRGGDAHRMLEINLAVDAIKERA